LRERIMRAREDEKAGTHFDGQGGLA